MRSANTSPNPSRASTCGPRTRQRAPWRGGGQSLDRPDRPGAHGGDRRHTGPPRLAIHMDGAGAARRDAAAILRARQPEHVPQHPEHGRVGLYFRRVGLLVDGERVAHDLFRASDGRKLRQRHWRCCRRPIATVAKLRSCCGPADEGVVGDPTPRSAAGASGLL